MKNFAHSKKRIFVVISSFFFVCLLSICVFAILNPKEFWDEFVAGGRPQQNPSDDPPREFKYYQIDPSTILADLRIGKIDMFHLLENEPESFKDIYPSGTYSWSQEDYLAIAKAHHLYLTGESMEGEWEIFSFGKLSVFPCRDDMKGFDRANIIFYKETAESFPVTYMYIRPLEGLIYSAYVEYERRPLAEGFSKADVFEGNITVEDALQIAEQAGGMVMRQKLSNDGCYVRATYFSDEYWHIDYSWDTDDLEFDLDFKVSASDGSYIVSQRKYKCERAICP